MIWKWFKHLYTVKVENPRKVQLRLNALNFNQPGRPWIAVPGFNVMTGIRFDGDSAVFEPNRGYPVKVFVNKKTGEVRTYAAYAFRN